MNANRRSREVREISEWEIWSDGWKLGGCAWFQVPLPRMEENIASVIRSPLFMDPTLWFGTSAYSDNTEKKSVSICLIPNPTPHFFCPARFSSQTHLSSYFPTLYTLFRRKILCSWHCLHLIIHIGDPAPTNWEKLPLSCLGHLKEKNKPPWPFFDATTAPFSLRTFPQSVPLVGIR